MVGIFVSQSISTNASLISFNSSSGKLHESLDLVHVLVSTHVRY